MPLYLPPRPGRPSRGPGGPTRAARARCARQHTLVFFCLRLSALRRRAADDANEAVDFALRTLGMQVVHGKALAEGEVDQPNNGQRRKGQNCDAKEGEADASKTARRR